MDYMSKLLINESPLTFQPSLASAIGLNEAIVLQQIHYWLSNSKNKGYEQDGYKWVYNTYKEWQENNFPFWSENTVQRVFASLEEKGLVISIQPMKSKYDRTKYYRIDYPKLDAFDDPKLGCSLDESETTTETTAEKKTAANIFKIYTDNIGILTPMLSDELAEIEDTYPEGWFEDAVKEAVKNNVRKLNYIKKILESWKLNGRAEKKEQKNDIPRIGV